MDKALSIEEAKRILKVSSPVAYELVRSGKLRAAKCGRQWRISQDVLKAFLRGERAD
jgi:excisionase family DNA binding protein